MSQAEDTAAAFLSRIKMSGRHVYPQVAVGTFVRDKNVAEASFAGGMFVTMQRIS